MIYFNQFAFVWNVLGDAIERAAVTQLYHETQHINRRGQHGNRKRRLVARNILHHKVFVCDFPQCSKRYATPIQLRTHKYWHQNKAKYVCGICDRSFPSNALCDEHKISHFPQLIKFRCERPDCGKGFLVEKHYKQHLLTHGGFKCLEASCGKSFASRYNLKVHLKKHLNLLAYRCDVCPDKSFPNHHRLNAHQKTRKHAAWKNHRLNKSSQCAENESWCRNIQRNWKTKKTIRIQTNLAKKKCWWLYKPKWQINYRWKSWPTGPTIIITVLCEPMIFTIKLEWYEHKHRVKSIFPPKKSWIKFWNPIVGVHSQPNVRLCIFHKFHLFSFRRIWIKMG